MSEITNYVRVDEHGVMRVGRTHVMLDSVIAGFEGGHSPETIRQQYPALRLEEVYGSIAYYLANRAEIDKYLSKQDQVWAQLKAENDRNPGEAIARLRGLKGEGAPEAR